MSESRYTTGLKAMLVAALVVFTASASVSGQGREIRWLRVGSLHSWFQNRGAEVELGRTGRATEQQDGLRWPAQFTFQDCLVGKAMWIGTTNFADPIAGQTFPFKVVAAGPRENNLDPIGEIMPYDFKMVGRFLAPTVIVDGDRASANDLNDVVDEVDPTLLADRMIVDRLHSSIGLSISRSVMAFAQQNHDNYFIYDYVFKNTGIVNRSGGTNPQTLTDVVIHFSNRYGTGSQAFKDGWAASNNISWGRNTVNETVGQDPGAPGFEFRAQYSFYGPHSQSPVDDWGAPDPQTGRMAGVHYVGFGTLHADTSPSDPRDDRSQPFTTQFVGSDSGPVASNQFSAELMARKYGVMSAGHPDQTHAQQVGAGFADRFGTDAGGYMQGHGYGPYMLQPGDSIRIVVVEAVAGLSREKTEEVGKRWFEDAGGFELPDGSTTSDADAYKRAWVQTGRDSLFQTFRRAITNFESGYGIAQAPPPPNVFEINSGGDRVSLSWSANAETWPNFAGYRIYRAVAKPDTFYTMIFETTTRGVNSFDDVTAQRGFDYYYYIQTIDDGSTNTVSPGTPLASSKFYTMTNRPAFLRRPAGESLDDIRIVPNPFDVRARDLQFAGAPDRIAFFGLPPQCTIRIFTERGDLVHTIEHTDGSGDELWNSLTSSGQVIVSGLYIVHFLTPEGESTYKKFIVIR
ncbi:MAG TPA: hypothetical protein VJB15_00875 [Rhodothermia bacterium]|nr:hypothetical protein [Rhodothermia bacterium]